MASVGESAGEEEESEDASLGAGPIGSLFDDDDETTTDEEDDGQLTPKAGEEALDEFRLAWRAELASGSSGARGASPATSAKASRSHSPSSSGGGTTPRLTFGYKSEVFQRAAGLFRAGIAAEAEGRMHDAIKGYTAAIRAVPDIERLLFAPPKPAHDRSPSLHSPARRRQVALGEVVPVKCESLDELMKALAPKIYAPDGRFLVCRRETEQEGRHLSELPVEVLAYVVRWVVGSELDFRSLEVLSQTSPGLFVLSREEEAWRLGCERLWGPGGAHPPGPYLSWRGLYLDRPHPLFGGVYIAKTSYIRHGEESFQDQFYKPWHLVVYYRYLRFWADGRVGMLTTAEEPQSVLGQLREPGEESRLAGLVYGRWAPVAHDEVSLQLVWRKAPDARPSRHLKAQLPYECLQRDFAIDLRVEAVKRRRSAKMSWLAYRCSQHRRDGSQLDEDIDLTDQAFPSLYYSRVRSFTAQATQHL